jgi:hypothetical protein
MKYKILFYILVLLNFSCSDSPICSGGNRITEISDLTYIHYKTGKPVSYDDPNFSYIVRELIAYCNGRLVDGTVIKKSKELDKLYGWADYTLIFKNGVLKSQTTKTSQMKWYFENHKIKSVFQKDYNGEVYYASYFVFQDRNKTYDFQFNEPSGIHEFSGTLNYSSICIGCSLDGSAITSDDFDIFLDMYNNHPKFQGIKELHKKDIDLRIKSPIYFDDFKK